MNPFLTALAALIQPAINYAEQKIISIGASFGAGLMAIALNIPAEQRAILVNVVAFWQAKHQAAVTAGASPLDAIEQATTASLTEFCAEEGAAGNEDIKAVLQLLGTAAKSAAAIPAI